jgi:F-type H+-transporting ATPase subunit gamma
MPTLKEIGARIKAVAAIKDTTEAMKMIAQAKVAKAEARLVVCRSFSRGIEDSFNDISEEVESDNHTVQFHVLGTDQGLCGSINSGMGRYVNAEVDKMGDQAFTIFPQGNRLISNLNSKYSTLFDGAFFNSQKSLTFRQCLAMADITLATGDFGSRRMLYNKMINMASYAVEEKVIPARAGLANTEAGPYEVEGGTEVLEDYYDFHYACSLWRLLSEVETSELSSRSMAMTNSTTAAADMEAELSLLYSKQRQEESTTEIIEISTGATQTLKANKKED